MFPAHDVCALERGDCWLTYCSVPSGVVFRSSFACSWSNSVLPSVWACPDPEWPGISP